MLVTNATNIVVILYFFNIMKKPYNPKPSKLLPIFLTKNNNILLVIYSITCILYTGAVLSLIVWLYFYFCFAHSDIQSSQDYINDFLNSFMIRKENEN